MLEFFATYWRPISISFSAIALLITLIKLTANSIAINKIQNNEIKHIIQDIKTIKEEEKDFKKELKEELHNVYLALKRIEKKQHIRDAVCEERHKNDK